MGTVPAFFEATFTEGSPQNNIWHDESNNEFYIFRSAFGNVRLKKRHAYPATFAKCSGELLYFGYGNPQRGKAITSNALTATPEEMFGVEEFLYCEVDCHNKSIVIQRDTACVLPIFAAQHGGMFALSNHSERLYDMLDPRNISINTYAALSYILFDDRHRPLLEGCEVLSERSRLKLHNGTYTIHQPTDGSVVNSAHEPESNPLHFKQALESTLNTYWQRYNAIGFQLSGGLDSALAPGYYADQGQRVLTVTLGLPGVMGRRQRQKLSDIQQRFKFEQYTVDLDPSKHFPFASTVATGGRGLISELSDIHLVATRQLADYLVERGVATVFTGVGGDELCQNVDPKSVLPTNPTRYQERFQTRLPDYTTKTFASLYQKEHRQARGQSIPVPAIAHSVLITHLSFNNTFIDRNIWPVAPLADPALFLFTQHIPAWYRYNKNLLRIYQYARGYPESIVHPTTVEDFSEFIHLCKPILMRLFTTQFANAHLEACGLINKVRLEDYVRTVIAAPFDASDTRILELLRLFTLEWNLQKLSNETATIMTQATRQYS